MGEFYVVLVSTEFESTIGLIARAMKNFGLRHLNLVTPAATIGREARMRASHAQEVLDNVQMFGTLHEALAYADISVATTAQRMRSLYKIRRRPVTPSEFAKSVGDVNGQVALVFGPEGTGLRNDELDQCDMLLTIPASPAYPTLNISHAAAIVFHEIFATKSKAPREILANSEVKRKILGFIEEESESVGFPLRQRKLLLRAFRSMMGRSGIRAREASLIAGFLRKTTSQLEQASKPAGNPDPDSTEQIRQAEHSVA